MKDVADFIISLDVMIKKNKDEVATDRWQQLAQYHQPGTVVLNLATCIASPALIQESVAVEKLC